MLSQQLRLVSSQSQNLQIRAEHGGSLSRLFELLLIPECVLPICGNMFPFRVGSAAQICLTLRLLRFLVSVDTEIKAHIAGLFIRKSILEAILRGFKHKSCLVRRTLAAGDQEQANNLLRKKSFLLCFLFATFNSLTEASVFSGTIKDNAHHTHQPTWQNRQPEVASKTCRLAEQIHLQESMNSSH